MKQNKSSQVINLRTVEHESYFNLVWQKLRKSKIAILGALMVIFLLVLALFSEFFAPYDPVKLEMKNGFTPPSNIHFIDIQGRFHIQPFIYTIHQELNQNMSFNWVVDTSQMYRMVFFVRSWKYKLFGFIPADVHLYGVEKGGQIYLLGTDKYGRDIFSRMCLAGRISLSMSLFGTIVSVALGSILGIISGYYSGNFDTIFQRFVEFVQSFPQLALWMALAAIIPRTWDQLAVFVAMSMIFALLSWTLLAREVRGKVLSLRESDFIMAAREMGASDSRIIFFHLFPNILSHTIVILTLTVPSIILAESFLSFLGIGIQEPLVSWGVMMRETQTIQTLAFNLWVTCPVIFIIIAVLGFNCLGDGLRDAADPYSV